MVDNSYSKSGFTLVELLAVIVVLAVVMLIGVNAVLPQMDRARRNAVAIEMNGFIKSAQQYYIVKQMGTFVLDKGATCCVSLDQLIAEGQSELKKEEYTGYVLIKNNNGTIQYGPYLEKKGTFYINGTDFKINDRNYNESDAKSVSTSGKPNFLTCKAVVDDTSTSIGYCGYSGDAA